MIDKPEGSKIERLSDFLEDTEFTLYNRTQSVQESRNKSVTIPKTLEMKENGRHLDELIDIIHCEQSEKVFKSERDMLRALFEGLERTGIGMYVVRVDYQVLHQNGVLRERFGKVKRDPCYVHYRKSATPCPSCPMIKSIINGTAEHARIETSDGRKMELLSAPLPNADGSVDRAMGVFFDETERLKAEEGLRESEEKYRKLFESSIEGIGVSKGNQLVSVNKSALDILGYDSIEEMTQIPLVNHIAPESRDAVKERLERRMKGESVSPRCEYTVICKNGTRKTIEILTTEVIIQNEKYILATFRDITERIQMERALRKSEEKYRTLAENINVGVYRNAFDSGEFIEVNPALVAMFGYTSKDDLRSKDFAELFQDISGFQDISEKLKKQSYVRDEELKLKRKDGTLFVGSMSAVAVRDEKGEISHCDGIIEDITERKEAEEALRKSEEKYRNILESIEDGYFEVDVKGNITFFNDSLCKILGYPAEELQGMSKREFMDEGTIREAYQVFNEVYRTGKSARASNWEIIRKDGTKRTIEASVSLIHDSKGECKGFRGIARDVTERKKAEEELMLLSAAVKMSNDSILITDMEGRIISVNRAALRMYGTCREGDLIYKNGMSFVAPEDRKKVEASIEKILENGYSENQEFDVVLKDGSRITLETNIAIMRDAEGHPKGAITIARDITERKKAERKMKRKLMKYNLDEGIVYCASDHMCREPVEAFKDLLKVGYPGLVISRAPRDRFEDTIDNGFQYLWLAERDHNIAVSPDLAEIEKRIAELPRGAAVLIDRLDYLILKNGFKETLSFVCNLREMAYLHNHVIILSVDSSTMTEQESNQLKKETEEIVPLDKKISKDLLEILNLVYQQNIRGKKPSYTDTGIGVGLSKPTARKKIRILINKCYLKNLRKGRKKVLEVTEKGKIVLMK